MDTLLAELWRVCSGASTPPSSLHTHEILPQSNPLLILSFVTSRRRTTPEGSLISSPTLMIGLNGVECRSNLPSNEEGRRTVAGALVVCTSTCVCASGGEETALRVTGLLPDLARRRNEGDLSSGAEEARATLDDTSLSYSLSERTNGHDW